MPSTRMSINNDSDKENTMDMEDVVMNNTNNSKEHSQNSRLKKYENIIGSNIYDPDQDKNEKRWLRKEYRSLIEETEEYLRPDSDGLEKNIAKANELYEKVKNTHEATLDSRLLVLSSDLGLQKARRMRLDNNCFDTEDYISKVVGRLKVRNADNEDYYDWKKIGKLAAQSTLRVPTTGFILGPLSIEQKERQKTVRRVLEKHEKDLKTPVENINIRVIAALCEPPTSDDYAQGLIKKQLVMEIDMDTWKDIIEVYGINESVIPTRESNQVGNDADRTIEDLTKEVDVWTATLENYIDTVIEENNETFKNKSQIKVSDVVKEY
ncbi:18487_t:CDS:2 [Entrophospora sp. SA101]|nr:18481_t:CDS:2 [Entrophospora sp. SA101]CAJ0909097.1 18487_t:CDS:2 [Entrophospora sp. SA101]